MCAMYYLDTLGGGSFILFHKTQTCRRRAILPDLKTKRHRDWIQHLMSTWPSEDLCSRRSTACQVLTSEPGAECEFCGERRADGRPLTGLEPFPPWNFAKKKSKLRNGESGSQTLQALWTTLWPPFQQRHSLALKRKQWREQTFNKENGAFKCSWDSHVKQHVSICFSSSCFYNAWGLSHEFPVGNIFSGLSQHHESNTSKGRLHSLLWILSETQCVLPELKLQFVIHLYTNW